MAKTKQGKRDVDSYTIRGTTKVVQVGDCVLMRPSDTDKQPYVARVESLESDGRGGASGCGAGGTTVRRSPRAADDNSTGPRSSSSPTTSTRRARTPSRASASSTPSRTTPSSTTSARKTSSADSSTRRPPARSPLTVLPCTASVRCRTTLMISWCSVRDAKTGSIQPVWK
uniref:Uncharacterized protein n=1 Tax=Avena sativa TaxID=4498 RepID=A0ACD5YG16_AVESA